MSAQKKNIDKDASEEKSETGYVFTQDKPVWIDTESEKLIMENDFAKIRTFFQDHTPNRKASARSVSLEEYGWHDADKLQSVLFYDFDKKHYSSAKSLDDMKNSLEKIGLGTVKWYESNEEKVCLCTYGDKKIDSLFGHLRNVFAHCRFSIKSYSGDDYLFVFEDMAKENRVSARMLLKKSTLENWMKLITDGQPKSV